jgi:hypothetical protein
MDAAVMPFGEPFARHRAETERVIEFTVGEQPGVRSDHRTTILQRQPAVKIEPQCSPVDSPAGFAITSASKSD